VSREKRVGKPENQSRRHDDNDDDQSDQKTDSFLVV
jgi:hypothetical protein